MWLNQTQNRHILRTTHPIQRQVYVNTVFEILEIQSQKEYTAADLFRRWSIARILREHKRQATKKYSHRAPHGINSLKNPIWWVFKNSKFQNSRNERKGSRQNFFSQKFLPTIISSFEVHKQKTSACVWKAQEGKGIHGCWTIPRYSTTNSLLK